MKIDLSFYNNSVRFKVFKVGADWLLKYCFILEVSLWRVRSSYFNGFKYVWDV